MKKSKSFALEVGVAEELEKLSRWMGVSQSEIVNLALNNPDMYKDFRKIVIEHIRG